MFVGFLGAFFEINFIFVALISASVEYFNNLNLLRFLLLTHPAMVTKLNQKKRAKYEAQKYVEDLDLQIEDPGSLSDEDENIVHNRRQEVARSRHASSVLPSDAHCVDGYGDDEYGFAEEHALAEEASKELKKIMREDDFDVPGVAVGISAQKKAKRPLPEVSMEGPVIESIERDFTALSNSERLRILQKESPELLKMLSDLREYLDEIKSLAKPLHELLHEQKFVSDGDKNLVSFLETKVQLMLSYCIHVFFYLLLKLEGKKIADHPVLDTLVEIRVYLEKMWPLNDKLQYSLNRLLSGKRISAVEVDRLRPVDGAESGFALSRSRSAQKTEMSQRRREQQAVREAEELEKEELASMTRVRTKKASQLHATQSAPISVAPLSYREDEDQYFSQLTRTRGGDSDDDEEHGLSLIETLRRRQAAVKEHQNKKVKGELGFRNEIPHEENESDDLEEDGIEEEEEHQEDSDLEEEGMSEDDEYGKLWNEEKDRQQKSASEVPASRGPIKTEEVDRRKAGKKIEAHRGLTKSRPKDRKNPRVAQRRKYERGMQIHKAQTRVHKPEEEGRLSGVRTIKPGVVRSRTLS